jgi:hypothetical protein
MRSRRERERERERERDVRRRRCGGADTRWGWWEGSRREDLELTRMIFSGSKLGLSNVRC